MQEIIIGVFDPGIFSIGDTYAHRGKNSSTRVFLPLRLSILPESVLLDSMKRKQFVKGINQIAQEGAIQIFRKSWAVLEEIIVGVVGVLQLTF